jgi:hypothetical protein
MKAHISCRILTNTEGKRAAFAIVQKLYRAHGYLTGKENDIAQHAAGSHATQYGLFYKETMFGTVSIVEDSEEGLPMDASFKDELDVFRKEGKKLIEAGQFAVDHEIYKSLSGGEGSPFAGSPLIAEVFRFAIEHNIDYICITINPKHDRFYEVMGFTQIGGLRHYPSVNAPGIGRVFYVPEWRTSSFVRGILEERI